MKNDKRFNQKSHDLARRMACGAPIDDSELDGLFDKTDSDWKETQYIVVRLLKQFYFVTKQNLQKRTSMAEFIFFPYDPSLIHWDAVDDNFSQDPKKFLFQK